MAKIVSETKALKEAEAIEISSLPVRLGGGAELLYFFLHSIIGCSRDYLYAISKPYQSTGHGGAASRLIFRDYKCSVCFRNHRAALEQS